MESGKERTTQLVYSSSYIKYGRSFGNYLSFPICEGKINIRGVKIVVQRKIPPLTDLVEQEQP